MFSAHCKTHFSISITFILSSANAFNLAQCKILSFGKELNTNQSINQSFSQSFSQSINQSINQSFNQSINHSISQSSIDLPTHSSSLHHMIVSVCPSTVHLPVCPSIHRIYLEINKFFTCS